jgi:hypothetical protein
MEFLFTILITMQFLVIVLHDWVDIRGLAHGRQVQAVVGRRKLAIATAINAIFPGLAVLFAFYFWRRAAPAGVVDYWLLYCAITLGSAIAMWYVPYLFGASARTREMYSQMYLCTRHILPARGDNPRPNLVHICFHLLFATNLILAVILRFGHRA